MNALLKIMLSLALFFASTFLLLKSTGIITIEKIETWLVLARSTDIKYVMVIVIGLLFADLFVAVPTLTVMILGGFFLGANLGAAVAICGLLLAGSCGYVVSHRYGYLLLNQLVKEPIKRRQAVDMFQQHGAILILLSRAMPILPEVSACMAGLTKMPFPKFITLWLLNSVPYAVIASYAGSISSIDNPLPAILTAIGLTAISWFGWLIFNRSRKSVIRRY